jgi:hypothetical protein
MSLFLSGPSHRYQSDCPVPSCEYRRPSGLTNHADQSPPLLTLNGSGFGDNPFLVEPQALSLDEIDSVLDEIASAFVWIILENAKRVSRHMCSPTDLSGPRQRGKQSNLGRKRGSSRRKSKAVDCLKQRLSAEEVAAEIVEILEKTKRQDAPSASSGQGKTRS